MLPSRYVGAALVVLSLIAAPVVDVVVLGGDRLIASLYGLPILLAAPHWRPRAVTALAALVVGLHAVVGIIQRHDFELWLLYTLSLVMIAALGILLSAQRQQTERRAHEAEEARRQLQTFTSMVAHELATPVAGVLGRAQLSLRTARASRERRALVSIESEARNLARLVEDLRDAGHVGAGQFGVTPEPTDLSDLVARVVERWRRATRDREIVLTVRDQLYLDCDRGRVVQVVGNLISNAVKYSSPDSPIAVEVSQEGGAAVLTVADRGTGISDAERARLFQPFSRLDGTRGTPGSGLGLYISRAIVEAHGGTIDVTSTPGAGSTFVVRLPGAADPAGDAIGAQAEPA